MTLALSIPLLFVAQTVSTTEQLVDAFLAAQPGTTITLADGEYFPGVLQTPRGGNAAARITVRAQNANQAIIHTAGSEEAFLINQPFWTFENLRIEVDQNSLLAYKLDAGGTDAQIFGGQVHLVQPYEHAIKGSGVRTGGPDRAHIRGLEIFGDPGVLNVSSNSTAIDFVAADDVIIENCFIHDIRKVGDPISDGISYGLFVKGNSRRAKIRNNIVTRVFIGISAGGGGTDPQFFRDGDTRYEAQDTLFANNIVYDTDDVALYVNQSNETQAFNNTFWNNFKYCSASPRPADCDDAGSAIDVRFPGSTLVAENNILSKPIKNRDNGTTTERSNLILPSPTESSWFVGAADGDFELVPDAPAIDRCIATDILRDIDNRTRPVGRGVDCGAKENPNPSANPRPYEGPITASMTVEPGDEEGGGCGCNAAERDRESALALVLAGLFFARRRR